MKTLILYTTKYGATKKAVEILQQNLKGGADIVNLGENKNPDLNAYSTVLLGGSVYMGSIQKEMKNFMMASQAALLEKKLGLFLVCGQDKNVEEQAKKIFPPELWEHAAAFGYFGFAYSVEKMNFLYRLILKKAAGITETKWDLKDDNIKAFAANFS